MFTVELTIVGAAFCVLAIGAALALRRQRVLLARLCAILALVVSVGCLAANAAEVLELSRALGKGQQSVGPFDVAGLRREKAVFAIFFGLVATLSGMLLRRE